MRRIGRALWAVVWAVTVFGFGPLGLGCGDDEAQLVVVVTSDLVVPNRVDALHVDVTGPDGRVHRVERALAEVTPAFPQSLSILRRESPYAPVTVVASGWKGATEVVRRTAVVTLAPGQTRVLTLELLESCTDVTCQEGETCARDGCRGVDIRPDELLPWNDAGVADGGPTDAAQTCDDDGVELCNGLDDDCDEDVDEGFDLSRDVRHCGACGRVCGDGAASVERAACVAGTCELSCVAGAYDCNEDPTDGCESRLADERNCGACGRECRLPGGSAQCVGGECVLSGCEEGRSDCDGAPANGCEATLTEPATCGACGRRCELANAANACVDGECAIAACEVGFADCDGVVANGCEAAAVECAECEPACPTDPRNGAATCTRGECALQCDPGFADCNLLVDDGCEASLLDEESCGSCAVRCGGGQPICVASPMGPRCMSSCGETTCGDACVDTGDDVRHCGGCGRACPARANASAVCSGGVCGFRCDTGYADCDADTNNGCEARLDSLDHCGACDAACQRPGAVTTCSGGTCRFVSCDAGRGDCDGNDSTGCETTLNTLADCGGCDLACTRPGAAATCGGGTCRIASCQSGYGNCDGIDDNGCEASLDTLVDCGACGVRCSAAHTDAECTGGRCEIVRCDDGWADCNMRADDGCETSLSTLANCGACGRTCAVENGTAACVAGQCAVASCDRRFDDCDGNAANGCEADLRRDASHCGGCGAACAAEELCVAGVCIGECIEPRADCDGNPANGCETNLQRSQQHCGACATACQARELCCGGACMDARSCVR